MAHKKLKVFSGHHVKEIGNFEARDAQDYTRKLNVCKEHKDEVRFYCEQCVLCICRDCAILEHRDHNFVSIDKGLQKKKSEIQIKMSEVQANGSRLREEKDFIEKRRIRMNNSIEKATEEVHRVAERNIALIRQHESSVTEQLFKQKEAYEAVFSNTAAGMDEKLTEIESSLGFCNDVLQRNNLPEILNVEKVLEQRFQELSKSSEFNMEPNYSGIKYVSNDFSSLKDSPGKLYTTNTEPSLSLAEGTGLTEVTQGEQCTFTVITKDSRGNKTYSEIDEVIVDIKSLQTGTSVKVIMTDSNDGCYKVSYKPETAGEFIVSITVAGEAIKGSPFQLKVKERSLGATSGVKKRGKSSGQQQLSLIRQPLCIYCSANVQGVYYKSQCGHIVTCKSCVKMVKHPKFCIFCGQTVLMLGNQPTGHMTCKIDSASSLPGYEGRRTITIGFNFDRGIQGPEHPNPGVPYLCFFCTAYLPDNPEGRYLCQLLRRAFDAHLIFTIGEDNTIVCNDIELKTSRSGGLAKCGYPDPEYLSRLKNKLASKGIE